jgi:DNA repair exonuclease SbcCD ATPase subunit
MESKKLPNDFRERMFSAMKALIVILVLACAGLGIGLAFRHKRAQDTERTQEAVLLQFSNKVVETSGKLEEQRQVNATLATDLTKTSQEVTNLAETRAELNAQLAKAQADAKAAAEAAQLEITKRETKINELETERDALTRRMNELSFSITNLNVQIAATEKKLAAAEGDREFLLKELKRMQAEKAELERQFNDLAVLREQVHKLKEQLAVARRLEFIRLGLYGDMKGAQRLMTSAKESMAPKPNYDLNVEIRQDGSGKVLPATNGIPATNSAPK